MSKTTLTILLMVIKLSSFAQQKTYLLGVNKIDSTKITKSIIDASILVLKKRLNKMSITNPTIYFDKKYSNFVIETKNEIDEEQINTVLILQHRASIFECYNTSEFLSLIQKDNSIKAKALSDAFVKQYVLPTSYETGYIGGINLKNISIANKNKTDLQSYYSSSVKLMYAKKEIIGKNDFVELYALKINSSILEINKILDSASIGFDAMGHPSLQLVFDSIGTKAFENLTDRNSNKFLAITIDELVILSPKVMGKITGGKVEISGSFTVKELQDFKNNLISGYLPISLYLKK